MDYVSNKLSEIMKQSSLQQLLLITDDRELQALLVTLNELLDHNQKITAEFRKTEKSMKKMLANISHDMKTPLTVVLGYIEMIQNKPSISEEERLRLLSLIHNKTYEIISLMNTFFDLARLESGDKDIPLARVPINECIKKSILSFYELVEAKGFQAQIELPDQPLYAFANEEALERVFNNLMSNAIRYGSDGDHIGVSLTYDEPSIFIEIWDNGKGINARDQELVFERMITLEESRNKAFQGSGLGLTITKRLVEAMGGDITLKSVPFQKTVFTVRLKRINY